MQRIRSIWIVIVPLTLIQLMMSCENNSSIITQKSETEVLVKKSNPIVYFEIPVSDIDRAIYFYKEVFQFTFEREVIDSNEMALFPFEDEYSGISGALAKGEIYKPTKDGVVIYFKSPDIDLTLELAIANGGKILYPKTDNGIGLVAEFEDTEGNRIALFQTK